MDWSPHPQVSRAEVWTVDLHNLFSVSFVMQGSRKALQNVGQGIGLSLHVRKWVHAGYCATQPARML